MSDRDPFANDVLERLARSNQDYQREHGHYIVPLAERLLRARTLAEHLFQMVTPQEWRDTGGDDGQGHYEGDYRAEQVMAEIKSWGSPVGEGRTGRSSLLRPARLLSHRRPEIERLIAEAGGEQAWLLKQKQHHIEVRERLKWIRRFLRLAQQYECDLLSLELLDYLETTDPEVIPRAATSHVPQPGGD